LNQARQWRVTARTGVDETIRAHALESFEIRFYTSPFLLANGYLSLKLKPLSSPEQGALFASLPAAQYRLALVILGLVDFTAGKSSVERLLGISAMSVPAQPSTYTDVDGCEVHGPLVTGPD
jgi:hypothetical protein